MKSLKTLFNARKVLFNRKISLQRPSEDHFRVLGLFFVDLTEKSGAFEYAGGIDFVGDQFMTINKGVERMMGGWIGG